MKISTRQCEKQLVVANGKVTGGQLLNLQNGETVALFGEEFILTYRTRERGLFLKSFVLKASDCLCLEQENTLIFKGCGGDGTAFSVTLSYQTKGDVICKTLSLSAPEDVFLECVQQDCYALPEGFCWSRAMPKDRVFIPRYIMTLGQPVYFSSFFTAYHSPVGDNKIEGNQLFLGYHVGRALQRDFNGTYVAPAVIVGAAQMAGFHACQTAFYRYVATFSGVPKFYITFNSWYDNMLDIDSAKIGESFRRIHDGFEKSGLRNIDCYVVDDGWVDYKKKEFWGFATQKFPHKFEEESKLTQQLGSKFGVWFGPRGGYSESAQYGRIMKDLGYGYCRESHDICTGHPAYLHDLGEMLINFMKKYNVEYFKLDGFSCEPCKNRHHGHPVGGENGIYYYTFLWEEWCKVFAKMKAQNPNVFINLTSYAHASPFFLEVVSAIWMNNAADMGYLGAGSDLEQCLTYRDSRYYDLQRVRAVQLPSQYIYNHEPNYGMRNYNTTLPLQKHKTVRYTDEEFERYLYGCMMRGSGFIELYYSPDLMEEGEKYNINARVLQWAEQNFRVIANAIYVGDSPLKGEIYGYLGTDQKDAILYLRNPSATQKTTQIDLSQYTFYKGEYSVAQHFPKECTEENRTGAFCATLAPFTSVIYVLRYL